jgi:tRNA1(Val) A37 N6-methylase TrmN6
MIALAKGNAKVNNLIDKTDYVVGDIHDKSLFNAEAFDHIIMNPPYYTEGERQPSPYNVREIAYTGNLEYWMASALHWVRQGGSLCLIHRADKLDEILHFARRKFGKIEIWPIHSKAEEPAIRIVVRMVRNRKSPLKIHPPIVLFDHNGGQSYQAKEILRNAKEL